MLLDLESAWKVIYLFCTDVMAAKYVLSSLPLTVAWQMCIPVHLHSRGSGGSSRLNNLLK